MSRSKRVLERFTEIDEDIQKEIYRWVEHARQQKKNTHFSNVQ